SRGGTAPPTATGGTTGPPVCAPADGRLHSAALSSSPVGCRGGGPPPFPAAWPEVRLVLGAPAVWLQARPQGVPGGPRWGEAGPAGPAVDPAGGARARRTTSVSPRRRTPARR